MHRNSSFGGHYPHGQQFNGGESPFRSPRPLYQSSPRHYGPAGSSSPQHNWSGPNNYMSSPHSSYGSSPRSATPYSSDNRRGPRGRGGFSPGYGTPRSGNRDGDHNPGHAGDITQYYNPSMIEDPWKHLQPVPVKDLSSEFTPSSSAKDNRLKALAGTD